MTPDWTLSAAKEIVAHYIALSPHDAMQPIAEIIRKHCPYKPDVAYEEVCAPVDYTHNDGVD